MINIALCISLLLSLPMTLERVVAVVGSDPVLHSDVVSLMIESGIDEVLAMEAMPSNPSYELAVEQLIDEKLLVEAARREGIYPPREEIEDAVDNAMNELRTGFYSEQEFLDFVVSAGMTLASLRDSYTSMLGDRMAGENFVRAKAGNAMASMPSDPVVFFQENPELVSEVLAPLNLSWIYIPVLPSETHEIEIFMSEVKDRISSGEITFSSAAAAYSQDGSASSGGDLGWFGRGDMAASFEKVVYDLEPGEVAGPFLTPFGVHLVKLTDVNRDEDTVRASHIIILAEITPADLEAAMQQAAELILLIENGMDFDQAVTQYSFDPGSFDSGGKLGTVNTGAWEGDMHDAVFELNPGELSLPVVIEQGMAVAIFRAEESQTIDWNDFTGEEQLSMLQSVYWQRYYSGMLQSLRDDIPVVVNVLYEN